MDISKIEIDKLIYRGIRHRIKTIKLKEYLIYLKGIYPDKDLHHLLGSQTGIKLCDALVVDLTREQHIWAEKNKSEAFFMYLPRAIELLCRYIEHLETKIKERKNE